MSATGELGRLFDEWRDGHRFKPSKRQIAAALEVSPTTIDQWRTGTMPSPANLAALAREMHYPYRKLLDAALADQGYLPEPNPLGESVRQRLRDRGLEKYAQPETEDDTPASGSA